MISSDEVFGDDHYDYDDSADLGTLDAQRPIVVNTQATTLKAERNSRGWNLTVRVSNQTTQEEINRLLVMAEYLKTQAEAIFPGKTGGS